MKGETIMDYKKEQARVTMIDPYKLWKKLYFNNEQVWTAAVRDFINTDLFANSIDLVLNTYLQYLRFHNDLVDRFTEESPLASKRDVARVAELVVSLENKVDGMELDFEEISDSLKDNLFGVKNDPSQDDLIGRIAKLETLMKDINTNLTALKKQMQATTKPVRATAKKDTPPKSENK
jgi:polyhydroxyalkanoic acid synthase PhaR subunit